MNTEESTKSALCAESLSRLDGKYARVETLVGVFSGVLHVGKSTLDVDFESDRSSAVAVPYEYLVGVEEILDSAPLKVWSCKSVCGCPGIRFLGSTLGKFPCRFADKYGCSVDEIADFSRMPMRLRRAFLDGLGTPLPYSKE